MQAQPYLFFEGRAEEAAAFYKRALGAEVTFLLRFKDGPEMEAGPECRRPEGTDDKVMHMSLKVGETTLMGSDGLCSGKPGFGGFSLALTARDAGEADRLFNALAEEGQVQMPLAETFFSPRFGMVADKFGVSWMIVTERADGQTQAAE